MIAGNNRVIVKTKKVYDDTIPTKSGVLLYKDPTIRKELNVVTCAEVHAVPGSLNTSRPLIIPGTEATVADIVPEVIVGDKIHFKYGVILESDDSKWPENLVMIDGEWKYYQVFYDQIVAIERDEIIPVGSHVLLEHIEDEEEVEEVVINPFKDIRKDRGVVRYIGNPLRGRRVAAKVGDTVTFRKFGTASGEPDYVEIGPLRYWVVYQDEIFVVHDN